MRKTLTTTERAAVGLIKNDHELDGALEEFDVLMDLGRNRTGYQDDRYHLLALVIEHYESQKYSRVKVDPVRIIKFAMDQHDLRQRDLIPYLGSKSRVSEVLNRKRKLTLKMMRKLHEGLGIPLEILVRDYELENG
jgi:HTH-type transcriptional regulator/antitoxin HigA